MARKTYLTFNRNKQDRTTQKPVVCSRCKGKGLVVSKVAHIGVPGLCFKCDGHGKVYFVTTEEARKSHLEGAKAELKRLEALAAETKAKYQRKIDERNERRAAKGKPPVEMSNVSRHAMEMEIEQLRVDYRRVRAEVRLCEAGDWPRLDRQARLI